MADELKEPLRPEAARFLIREILRRGLFSYSKHAKEEMLDDGLTTVDFENILRAGISSVPVSTKMGAGDTMLFLLE